MIALMCSPIATDKDIEQYQTEFGSKETFANKETFIKVSNLYDNTLIGKGLV